MGRSAINNWTLIEPQIEQDFLNVSISLSNWNMGGTEYGGFSGGFSYGQRLKINDLRYTNQAFFGGKTIISSFGTPNYPNGSLGYVSAEWIDNSGNLYYSLISQTSSPNHFFNINNLAIKDSSSNFFFYQDKYSQGQIFSSGSTYSWNLSNWNSSGGEYGGFSGSCSTPAPAKVKDLITFRGAYSGSAQVVHNAMAQYGYPVAAYGYLAILFENASSPSIQYLAIISQYVSSFSINVFTLSSSIIHNQSPWSSGGHGQIINPSSSGSGQYKGVFSNPSLSNFCLLEIAYTDGSTQTLNFDTCPQYIFRIDDEDQICHEACNLANEISRKLGI